MKKNETQTKALMPAIVLNPPAAPTGETPAEISQTFEKVTDTIYLHGRKLSALLKKEAASLASFSPLNQLALNGIDAVHGRSLIMSCFGKSQSQAERADFWTFSVGIMPTAKSGSGPEAQFALLHGVSKADLDGKNNGYARGQVSRAIKRIASAVLAEIEEERKEKQEAD